MPPANRFAHRLGGFAAVLLVASAAYGQEIAESPPTTPTIRAVERGLFMQADVGLTVFVNELDGRRYNPGPQVGVVIGYDVLPILSLGAGVAFWGGEIVPPDDDTSPRSDLFTVTPLIRAQLAVLTTERNYVWVRGDFG
ncbi:MAG: hypothetical protein AAF449_10785, partial [Myxococcota bacterium]